MVHHAFAGPKGRGFKSHSHQHVHFLLSCGSSAVHLRLIDPGILQPIQHWFCRLTFGARVWCVRLSTSYAVIRKSVTFCAVLRLQLYSMP
jgi:hypothetical protein